MVNTSSIMTTCRPATSRRACLRRRKICRACVSRCVRFNVFCSAASATRYKSRFACAPVCFASCRASSQEASTPVCMECAEGGYRDKQKSLRLCLQRSTLCQKSLLHCIYAECNKIVSASAFQLYYDLPYDFVRIRTDMYISAYGTRSVYRTATALYLRLIACRTGKAQQIFIFCSTDCAEWILCCIPWQQCSTAGASMREKQTAQSVCYVFMFSHMFVIAAPKRSIAWTAGCCQPLHEPVVRPRLK